MEQWFRSWHGAPTDNKWLVIARRAGVAPMAVSAVFWALLDFASQQTERGNVAGFDPESYSMWAGCNEADVIAIIAAMRDKGIISDDDRLTAWERRQPRREDASAERVRRFRDKAKDDVTQQPVINVTQCNASSDNVTQCNGEADSETQCNHRLDKSRSEEIREEHSPAEAVPSEPKSDAPARPLSAEFQEVQEELKTGKNKAATLQRWYVRCFGDGATPDYGYLGRVAKHVGGAGHLAQLMMQLAPRPPAGDVLAYILASHKEKPAGDSNGFAPSGTNGNGSGWAMPLFTGSEK